jgi:hypothetical protein
VRGIFPSQDLRVAQVWSPHIYPTLGKYFLGGTSRAVSGDTHYKNALKNEKCPKFRVEPARGGASEERARDFSTSGGGPPRGVPRCSSSSPYAQYSVRCLSLALIPLPGLGNQLHS